VKALRIIFVVVVVLPIVFISTILARPFTLLCSALGEDDTMKLLTFMMGFKLRREIYKFVEGAYWD